MTSTAIRASVWLRVAGQIRLLLQVCPDWDSTLVKHIQVVDERVSTRKAGIIIVTPREANERNIWPANVIHV